MGFYEDERIRSKNRIHNIAYQLLTNLKQEGLSDDSIAEYAISMIKSDQDRNDIYSTVLKIVGRSDVQVPYKSPADTKHNGGSSS